MLRSRSFGAGAQGKHVASLGSHDLNIFKSWLMMVDAIVAFSHLPQNPLLSGTPTGPLPTLALRLGCCCVVLLQRQDVQCQINSLKLSQLWQPQLHIPKSLAFNTLGSLIYLGNPRYIYIYIHIKIYHMHIPTVFPNPRFSTRPFQELTSESSEVLSWGADVVCVGW